MAMWIRGEGLSQYVSLSLMMTVPLKSEAPMVSQKRGAVLRRDA